MDPLIEQLSTYGMPGLALGVVLFLMRGPIMDALGSRTANGPELTRAIEANTKGLDALAGEFRTNNGLFRDVLSETKSIRSRIDDLHGLAQRALLK